MLKPQRCDVFLGLVLLEIFQFSVIIRKGRYLLVKNISWVYAELHKQWSELLSDFTVLVHDVSVDDLVLVIYLFFLFFTYAHLRLVIQAHFILVSKIDSFHRIYIVKSGVRYKIMTGSLKLLDLI